MLPPVPDHGRPVRRLRQHEVYRNRFVTLYDDDVVFPDGQEGTHVRLVPGGGGPGVAALVTSGDRVALVLTHRYAIGEWQWAIPRGFGHGQDPTASIMAELREELGGGPTTLTRLGRITPDSGLLASEVHLYHAAWAEPQAVTEDPAEVQAIAWLRVADLRRAVAEQQVSDAFTLADVALADARGLI